MGKHRTSRVLIALTLALALQAPANAQGVDAASAPAELQEIPAQTLSKGQCALFLWSKARSQRIVMALSNPPTVRIRQTGRTIDLPRTDVAGDPVYGHYPHQAYAAAGARLTLDLVFDTERSLMGGAILREGSVEYRDAAGWSTVTPVGGMVACQS